MEKKVEENSWNIEQKILDLKNIENVVHRERVKSRKIVFTNGCFDLLHLGHLDVLRKSRNFGDCLIVGLNTDSSVKRLKGEFRPIQDEKTRVMILASLAFVDYVVLFEEDTPLELINVIRPDVLVKGGDYNIEQIVGADIVLKNGGEVKIVDILPGHSTTDLVKKMK